MGTEWYYWANEQQHGPISEDALKAMAAAGTLRPEDLVRAEPIEQWRPAGEATEWAFGPPPAILIPEKVAHSGPLSYASRTRESLILSPRAVDLLLRTEPWAHLVGVVGYVIGGIWALAGTAMVVRALAGSGSKDAAAGNAFVCFAVAVVSAFAGGYAARYAAVIRRLARAERGINLEDTFDAQRRFWVFCGIIAIGALALFVISVGFIFLMR